MALRQNMQAEYLQRMGIQVWVQKGSQVPVQEKVLTSDATKLQKGAADSSSLVSVNSSADMGSQAQALISQLKGGQENERKPEESQAKESQAEERYVRGNVQFTVLDYGSIKLVHEQGSLGHDDMSRRRFCDDLVFSVLGKQQLKSLSQLGKPAVSASLGSGKESRTILFGNLIAEAAGLQNGKPYSEHQRGEGKLILVESIHTYLEKPLLKKKLWNGLQSFVNTTSSTSN